MTAKTSFSGLQITLHWAIAVLIAANWLVSDGMGRALHQRLDGQVVTGNTPTFHVYAGITILVLVLGRLVVRLMQGAPEAPDADTFIGKIGVWTHFALYALMVLVPVIGMMAWFGGIEPAGDIHTVLMNVMMILVILHALAALYHQFVLRDGLLMRMLKPN